MDVETRNKKVRFRTNLCVIDGSSDEEENSLNMDISLGNHGVVFQAKLEFYYISSAKRMRPCMLEGRAEYNHLLIFKS